MGERIFVSEESKIQLEQRATEIGTEYIIIL
jgi:hypothetical protein